MALTNINNFLEFNYTGTVQTFTAEESGIYKFEVWGASGGKDGGTSGGKGGYSIGYKELTKGQTIYIVVGGAGAGRVSGSGGGYNGGGNAGNSGSSGAGGGATHIADMNGTLTEIGTSNISHIFIVAGGGGGEGKSAGGGAGGGLTGSNAGGSGGSQTSGGAGGTAGTFGQGAHKSGDGGGGGGGFYGGGSGTGDNGGGGGSGYIGGVPSFSYKGVSYVSSSTAGQQSGNGKAKITLVELKATIGVYIKINGVWKLAL